MNWDSVTVLQNVLRLTCEEKQGKFTADDETMLLCELELEHFTRQVLEQGKGKTDARVEKIYAFLKHMKNGQLLQAKDLSSSALDYYCEIQQGVFEIPNDFKFRYWQLLPKEMKEKVLDKVQNNVQQNRRKSGRTLNEHTNPHVKYNSTIQINANSIREKAPQNLQESNSFHSQLQPNSNNTTEWSKKKQHFAFTLDSEHTSKKLYPWEPMYTIVPKNSHHAFICGFDSGSAVYVVDENDREEEQGPTPHEEDTNEDTSPAFAREPIQTVEGEKNIHLNANSTKYGIATQFFVVYEEKHKKLIYEILKECQEHKKVIMEELITLVQEIEKICQNFAKEQIQEMIEVIGAVIGEKIPKTENASLLKEFQSRNADLSLNILYQKSQQKLRILGKVGSANLTTRTRESLNSFIQATTNVLWYMAIQKQPMILEYNCLTRDSSDYFKSLNRDNGRPNQVIWPAVRAVEGGPLIRKGVAMFI